MPDTPERQNGDRGYETRDVKGSLVFWSLASLAAVTVLSALGMAWMFSYLEGRPSPAERRRSPVAQERLLPPEPRLQALPPLDLEKFRAQEDARLNTYGWIDRDAGIAHIPVDRALELVAERGLPHGREAHRPQAPSAQAGAPPQRDAPSLQPGATPREVH